MLVVCVVGMGYVDTSQVYHLVRGQSVIKLYVIYNMLDVREREREKKRNHVNVLFLDFRSFGCLYWSRCAGFFLLGFVREDSKKERRTLSSLLWINWYCLYLYPSLVTGSVCECCYLGKC